MSEPSHDNIAAGAQAGDRICPSCGRDRPERFCARCGQSDRDYARSIGSVAGEFLRETFQLDSRLYSTLKLLFLRPGSLTREFSRNRRAGYVSPVRLYIFASFVFFLVLSLQGSLDTTQPPISVADRELMASQRPNDTRVEAFKAALPAEYRSKLEDILDRPDGDLAKEAVLGVAATSDSGEMAPIDRFFFLLMIDLYHDPSAIGERFIANMPVAMFFLLPFCALALVVFYFRKKRVFVEHLVFGMHVQTFTFVANTVALLVPDSGMGSWLRLGCLLLPYPYFLIALRRYYEDGWAWTVAKSVGVGISYSLVLIPAFLISIFVTR